MNLFRMKNILILGSSSGLGSFLKKFLSKKDNVITLKKKIGRNKIKVMTILRILNPISC